MFKDILEDIDNGVIKFPCILRIHYFRQGGNESVHLIHNKDELISNYIEDKDFFGFNNISNIWRFYNNLNIYWSDYVSLKLVTKYMLDYPYCRFSNIVLFVPDDFFGRYVEELTIEDIKNLFIKDDNLLNTTSQGLYVHMIEDVRNTSFVVQYIIKEKE